ncbi:uncharacterized protein PHALS_02093 [Plasmopara halstedii]|uniref:Uncharacterized protein n=1 Tax=Plasmopara halstedii TaxID=4781 RepID=A0A0P1AU85_PLAHL|nr:uncharacterized protein PHALS_02093 [Plasmopara halstedii]CEG45821.1 hypothetical protein PHALS_02093 [Plasmopara halstedii]|eukprot:XP_024582190.1 hypothetical protein PHALS_02093 [Plasmopara halstedii]
MVVGQPSQRRDDHFAQTIQTSIGRDKISGLVACYFFATNSPKVTKDVARVHVVHPRA